MKCKSITSPLIVICIWTYTSIAFSETAPDSRVPERQSATERFEPETSRQLLPIREKIIQPALRTLQPSQEPDTPPAIRKSPSTGEQPVKEYPPKCVLPGQVVSIPYITNQISSQKPQFYLNDGSQHHLLKRLNFTNSHVNLQIPLKLSLSSKLRYPIDIADSNVSGVFSKTGLTLRFCSGRTSSTKRFELLLSYTEQHHSRVVSVLGKNGLSIRETRSLDGLGLKMLKSEKAPEHLVVSLRRELPFAQIDHNDPLTIASSPRLFHKRLLTYDNNPACSDKAASKAKVGIIDGKIAADHISLKGAQISTQIFSREQTYTLQHATAIASLLVGRANKHGFEGLIPNSHLYSAEVLFADTKGQVRAETFSVIEGLNWLVEQQVRLVSISLVTPKNNSVLRHSIKRANQLGTVIFAAVGNNGLNAPPSYPATYPEVISITALDAAKRSYSLANQNSKTDFAAPGVDLWTASADINNPDLEAGAYVTGTSFASPIAMAIAAGILDKRPNISSAVIKRVMAETSLDLGDSGKDSVFGYGLVQQLCLD